MTERKSAGFSQKGIAQLYREELGVKHLYEVSDEVFDEEIGGAASRVMERLSLQGDQDAQRLITKGELMLSGLGQEPQGWEERLRVIMAGFKAIDRSRNAARAAALRWHRDKETGMLEEEFLAEIQEKNPHLYDVLQTYQNRLAGPSLAKNDGTPTSKTSERNGWLTGGRLVGAAATALAIVGIGYAAFRDNGVVFAGQTADKPAPAVSNQPDRGAQKPAGTPVPEPTTQKENKGTENAGGPHRSTPETGESQGDKKGNVPGSGGKSCENASDQGKLHGEPDPCAVSTPPPTESPKPPSPTETITPPGPTGTVVPTETAGPTKTPVVTETPPSAEEVKAPIVSPIAIPVAPSAPPVTPIKLPQAGGAGFVEQLIQIPPPVKGVVVATGLLMAKIGRKWLH